MIDFFDPRGDDDDGYVRRSAQHAQQIEPGDTRHHQVEHDEINAPALEDGEGFVGVPCAHGCEAVGF
jgi:hypothetical protein